MVGELSLPNVNTFLWVDVMSKRRVRHVIWGYTGVTDGTTRLKNLF